MKADRERLQNFIGEWVWLDVGYTNQSKVKLVAIHGDHFARVSDDISEWDVMMYSLKTYLDKQ